MKATSFKVTHPELGEFKWSFQYTTGLASTIRKGRMNGWLLKTHDGVERFSEGNWLAFVPFVHAIANNYGCACNIS